MYAKQPENLKSYVLPGILFPLLFLLTIFKMIDTDLWFHMKAGQVILETGRFIYKDIFSYTAAGREWLYHEWMFGVISYQIYSFFGINGLILGKSILLTLTFLLIYKNMRLRGANPYIASFILATAVLAARFRFTERPHIFKLLFVVAFIHILDLYRMKGKNRLWLLPFIQVLWVNMHGSFILSPIIIAIYLFSEAVSGKRQFLRQLSITLFITSLATLANPYGFKLVLFSLGFGEKPVLSSVSEWAPTSLNDFYGAFGLMFAAGLGSFMLRYKKTEVADLILFGLFAYLSIKAIRFTALFSLATAPVLAGNTQYIISSLPQFNIKSTRKMALAALIMIAFLGFLFAHESRRNPILVFGLGQGPAFPQGAVKFIKQNGIEGNMYNSFAFGGYLIWGLYPEKRVFVDGRVEVFDKDFQESFIGGASLNKWTEAVNRYGIDYAVVAYSSGGLDLIGKMIAEDASWVLIYWDDAARVYARNTNANQNIIGRYGHLVLANPVDFNYDSLKLALAKGLDKRLEFELKNDLESNHENATALYWLGMVYYETNRKDAALTAWKDAAKIRPDANTFSSIGNIYAENGIYKQAVTYYIKAVETDNKFVTGWYNLGNAYEMLNQKKNADNAYRKFIKYAGPEFANEVRALKEKGIE